MQGLGSHPGGNGGAFCAGAACTAGSGGLAPLSEGPVPFRLPPFHLPLVAGLGGWGGGGERGLSGWTPGSSEKCGTRKGPRCRAWCVEPRRHRGPDLGESRRCACAHSTDGRTEPCPPGSAGENFASFSFSLSLGSSSVEWDARRLSGPVRSENTRHCAKCCLLSRLSWGNQITR